jgi:hypothetical protein
MDCMNSQAAVWYAGVTVRQVPQCPRWLCGEVGEGVW